MPIASPAAYGSLSSDLPGKLTTSGSRRKLEGSATNGNARITLKSENGSVTLKDE